MARSTRSAKLETRTARLKLAPRKKPYSARLAPGVILLYRRNRGPGTWIVRLTGDGKDATYRLAAADDYAEADGRSTLDFWQAQAAARATAGEYEGTAEPVTIERALDDYEEDLKTRGGDLGNAKRARAHLPADWLGRTVSSLKAGELRHWRDKLAKALAPATVNRTATCLKAALNLAAERDERIARRPWERGLAGIPGAEEPRNVILREAQVRAVIAEAYRTGPLAAWLKGEARRKAEEETQRWADAFGLLVEVLAVTGARISQAARLEVRDLQTEGADPRLMMPSSRKGNGVKKMDRRPVPIPAALALKLRAAAGERPAQAPLLRKPGGAQWAKSDHQRPFERALDRLRTCAVEAAIERGADPATIDKTAAAFDGVTIYALRHSSIVRQLLAGVPIRVVAAGHDTSVAMIERTYSRFIGDHADALARSALLDVSKEAPVNVIELATRGR